MFLEIKNLFVEYSTQKGFADKSERIFAVNNLSLEINKGEILAIAGESGCGKSTLAKAILDLIEVKSGEIFFQGENVLQSKDLKEFRKKVQMVFQNPFSSLNPKMKIGEILEEPLLINTKNSKAENLEIVKKTLSQVGLDESCLKLYPHEFSGGQRQRVAIARALVLEPEFIVADEPVSALDVSIQAQIINLLKELKEKFNLTFLFISHDLSVIKYLADRVAIMYLGEVVEVGTSKEIFETPKHPYTKALLASAPNFEGVQKAALKGDLPSPSNLPSGCKFHSRCGLKMDKCSEICPNSVDISNTHKVNCFLYYN